MMGRACASVLLDRMEVHLIAREIPPSDTRRWKRPQVKGRRAIKG